MTPSVTSCQEKPSAGLLQDWLDLEVTRLHSIWCVSCGFVWWSTSWTGVSTGSWLTWSLFEPRDLHPSPAHENLRPWSFDALVDDSSWCFWDSGSVLGLKPTALVCLHRPASCLWLSAHKTTDTSWRSSETTQKYGFCIYVLNIFLKQLFSVVFNQTNWMK